MGGVGGGRRGVGRCSVGCCVGEMCMRGCGGASGSKRGQGICFYFPQESFGVSPGPEGCEKNYYRFLEVSRGSADSEETDDL